MSWYAPVGTFWFIRERKQVFGIQAAFLGAVGNVLQVSPPMIFEDPLVGGIAITSQSPFRLQGADSTGFASLLAGGLAQWRTKAPLPRTSQASATGTAGRRWGHDPLFSGHCPLWSDIDRGCPAPSSARFKSTDGTTTLKRGREVVHGAERSFR